MADNIVSTEQHGKFPHINPTGKGGFKDRPEDINAGGRPKNAESFAYWYGQFKNMSVKDLKSWQNDNPEDTRTVASDLAFVRVINARKDLREFQEVANRSEGMPKQSIETQGDNTITVTIKDYDDSK